MSPANTGLASWRDMPSTSPTITWLFSTALTMSETPPPSRLYYKPIPLPPCTFSHYPKYNLQPPISTSPVPKKSKCLASPPPMAPYSPAYFKASTTAKSIEKSTPPTSSTTPHPPHPPRASQSHPHSKQPPHRTWMRHPLPIRRPASRTRHQVVSSAT